MSGDTLGDAVNPPHPVLPARQNRSRVAKNNRARLEFTRRMYLESGQWQPQPQIVEGL